MKRYPIDRLRNLALIAHGGAGKTSLAEAMLYDAGAVDRLGRTDDGNSALDFDPEEIKRQISISLGVAPLEWNGAKLNLLDTPGYFDFVGEVKAALRVADSAVVIADAVAGVEVGTSLVWGYAEEYSLPRFLFVNKMDRENANFQKAFDSLKAEFGPRVIAAQLPIGAEQNFKGVVDLVQMQAYVHEGSSGKAEIREVPPELLAEAEEARVAVIEAAAENDDDLLMKYLEGEELTQEEIVQGFRTAVVQGKVYPVFAGSATHNRGIQAFMDAVVAYAPSPLDRGETQGKEPKSGEEAVRQPAEDEPLSALVFKTSADPYVGKLTVFRVFSGVLKSDTSAMNANRGRNERVGQLFYQRGKVQEPASEIGAGDIGAVAKLSETQTGDSLCDENRQIIYDAIEFPAPVYSVALMPKTKGDEDKIGSGITRLSEEDPTIRVERNTETSQTILSGMGDLHLDIITDRLKRKFGVEVNLEPPKIAYRETIRGSAKVEGKHKKQTGGRGQFGHVWIEFEPLPTGGGFEFVDKIFGGSVPRQYIPAVEKGLREALSEGVLAGYPTTDIRATLYDGSFHPVDSSEMAFKIAASLAYKKGCLEAKPVILEPIMSAEVIVPDQYMGDVMGDLNKKRGRILGMEPHGTNQVIRATVPASEMAQYAIDLRSITQGRGAYTMEFDHYEEAPANEAEKIIEAARKAKEA